MALTAKSMPYNTPSARSRPRSIGSRRRTRSVTAVLAKQPRRTRSRAWRKIGADSIACIVVEPIQGEGGFIVPAEDSCRRCRRGAGTAVVFVADEIQTGMVGRDAGSPPSTRASSLTSSRLRKAWPEGCRCQRSRTGRAHGCRARGWPRRNVRRQPCACAAALGARTIEEDGLLERATMLGERMRDRLQALQADNPVIGDVRGRGAMQRSSWYARNDGPSSRRRNSDRQALPRRRRRRPHVRHVRQRAPLPTATRDAGASARGRLRCGC